MRRISEIAPERLQRSDAWILWRLDVAIAECDAALGPLRPTTPSGAAEADAVHWTAEERGAGMRLTDLAETARRSTDAATSSSTNRRARST